MEKDGRKLPGWGAMGSCAAGKKAVWSGCVDPADDPGREPDRQNAHEKHEQGIFMAHRADEFRALLRGAPAVSYTHLTLPTILRV